MMQTNQILTKKSYLLNFKLNRERKELISIEGGFIKLYRSMLDWEWYTDNNVKILFLHCLFKANYKDVKFKGQVIPRGSFLTGLQTLADETCLTVRQIRTALDKLKSTNEITTKATSKGTLINVVNYTKFQDFNKETTSTLTNELTVERQTNDKPMTTSKEYKEINNIKEEIYKEEKVAKAPSFKKPSIEDISLYCLERKNNVNPNQFFDFYESKNWMVGKNKMKDYKACIRTWETRNKNTNKKTSVENYEYLDDYIKEITGD